jgi:hypothetical protein
MTNETLESYAARFAAIMKLAKIYESLQANNHRTIDEEKEKQELDEFFKQGDKK